MKEQSVSKQAPALPGGTHKRTTRAERKIADREAQREVEKRRVDTQREISRPFLIGGLLTVLVVAGVVVFALMRAGQSAATQSKGPGLTNPNGLSVASSLLSTGTVAPDFTMKPGGGMSGASGMMLSRHLASSYHLGAQRGHVLLLEFFAVWCPVCHAQAPTMARLDENYASRGVRLWGILANPYGPNYDSSGRTDLSLANRGDMSSYTSLYGVSYPLLVDPMFAKVNRYGVGSYPGIYIVGKNGKIRWASVGIQSYADLSKALNQALAAH
jgi:thiol-disulfide isomerase/thioredoxin